MVHVIHALQGALYHKWRYNICDWEFTNLDAPFDTNQILCTYRTEGLPHGELIRISFFHKEGMARFVGVGIDNLIIVIKASSSKIWVKEIDEEDWNQRWKSESDCYTTLMLQSVDQDVVSPSTHGNREDEQVYKRLKGTSLLHGLVKRILQRDKLRSRGNVVENCTSKSMRARIRGRGENLEDSGKSSSNGGLTVGLDHMHGLYQPQYSAPTYKVVDSTTEEDSSGTAKIVNTTTHSNPEHEEKDVCISTFSGMALSVVLKEIPRLQPKNDGTYQFLRVVVILNPHRTKLLEKIPTLLSPMAFPGEDDGVHEIQAIMTVDFYYRKDGGGFNGIKGMQVTLINHYGLTSTTPKNTNSSPWYHQTFNSYVKCLNPIKIRCEQSGVYRIHSMNNATIYDFFDVGSSPAVHFVADPSKYLNKINEIWWKDITKKAQFIENLSSMAYGMLGWWDLKDSDESYEEYEICMKRDLFSTHELIKNKIGIFESFWSWLTNTLEGRKRRENGAMYETKELAQQLTKTILISHTFDQMSYCDQ